MQISSIATWFCELGIPSKITYESEQTTLELGDGKIRITKRGSMLQIEFPNTTEFISEAFYDPGLRGFKTKFVEGLLQEPLLFREPVQVRYIPDKSGGWYECYGSFGLSNVKLHNDKIVLLDKEITYPLSYILRNYLQTNLGD